MLFLLCAAMIVAMTAATGIMLHAESIKPKAQKVRVYWR
jgi:type III secretory pathway component EscU